MKSCKIKVIKRNFDQKLVNDYLSDRYKNSGFGPCELFEDNEEFIVTDPNSMPEGFCAWAWSDIQKDLVAIMSGGNFNWMRHKGTALTCCSDGFRPVVFLIEIIENSEEKICLNYSK
ncbi:MAG: hypothetical protein APR54_11840 [Candidatus Cloacimonas sp. SDB]|nr:MAG: hypothetical protein APR54_11840 [Candidatus Cloacimonas sp. SDB]